MYVMRKNITVIDQKDLHAPKGKGGHKRLRRKDSQHEGKRRKKGGTAVRRLKKLPASCPQASADSMDALLFRSEDLRRITVCRGIGGVLKPPNDARQQISHSDY